MAKTYMIISIISFILCGIFLLISVTLFFVLKINRVIDFLSGKEAKLNIERIKNESKERKNEVVNVQKFDFTDIRNDFAKEDDTDRLSTETDTTLLTEIATTILGDEEETTILGNKFEIIDEITFVVSKHIICI